MGVNEMIEANKGLVYKQLHKFYLVDDQEAESIAYWALYKAISTHRASEGVLLSTYATCCIYNALGTYVRTLHKKRQLEVISYNTIAFEDQEHLNTLAAKETTESIVVRSELVTKTKEAIVDICSKTTNEKHKRIINAYVDSEYTDKAIDIAKTVGVTQSYVSQVLSEFKCKLKKKMEDYYYD